jgi:hypothetical protein
MEALVIHTVSLESARGYVAALTEFDAKLIEGENGRHQVEIPLGNGQEIVAALNALEEYVTHRDDGPARLEMNGRRYALYPISEPEAEPSGSELSAGVDAGHGGSAHR